MEILGVRTLAGPNVYSHHPAVVMRLDLEELAETESLEVGGFNERLLKLLPGLHEHTCSKGRAGGFVQRLGEGTYFGHIVEHVALELMGLAGVGRSHGKTRYAGAPGVYNVVVEYDCEECTRHLLGAAVELVGKLIRDEPASFAGAVDEAKRLRARTALGPSTRAIVEAATRRGIPWHRLNGDSLVQLGYGKYRKHIQAAMTSETSAIAVEIAGDKGLTKTLLEAASIPVPGGRLVSTQDAAVEALNELGAPVVVKPLDGQQGKGVSLNLSTPAGVVEAFYIAQRYSPSVLVEEQFEGRNYRVLVVGGSMVAASERIPCHVVGDGAHTIDELIRLENLDPRRGDGHENALTKIVPDAVMLAYMQKADLSFDHIPQHGEVVHLRESVNLSTGGTARDVTDEVHGSVRRMCERAARVVGMDVCGVDLMLPDIAEPLNEQGGIIELNAAPGLRMHLHPSEGEPRDVGTAIISTLYPPGAASRVPIISITGTNGKTSVTRMVAHVLGEDGTSVGMTTTDGIWIGGEQVAEGDTTGPHSARVVLSDRSVEVAVLETARGGIVRRGLGYDWSDISVMTNISADHIGQDGIESVEDLVYIKSLIAERVREGGTLILNADDAHLARLTEIPAVSRVEKKIVYFSLEDNNTLVEKHLEAGGTAYYVREGFIVEANGRSAHHVVRIADVPVTFGGTAEFQVANLMAAAAACRAYGVGIEEVARAVMNFRGDTKNPGRSGLYEVGGGYVLVDYGHNPEAFNAICRMTARWRNRHVTGIIGVPGDRCDALVEEAGRIAAKGFHRVVIKEDKDLRGRKTGEVAELLCRTVHWECAECECRIVLDEVEALRKALGEMRDGEAVVIFYDKLEPVLRVLDEHGARPTTMIRDLPSQYKAAFA